MDSEKGIKRNQFVRAVRAVTGAQVSAPLKSVVPILKKHASATRFGQVIQIHLSTSHMCAQLRVLFRKRISNPSQLKPDVLDVLWGIFDEDGDGRLTKSEFMDVGCSPRRISC